MSATSPSFIVDIETLDNVASAIILSAAIVAVDFEADFKLQDLKDRSIYVKFATKTTKGVLNTPPRRTASQDTIDWWLKQDAEVRDSQLKPYPEDASLEEGFVALDRFLKLNNYNKNATVWSRGYLDTIVLEDIAKQLGRQRLYHHWRERDVRTAIDCLTTTSNNGYCDTVPEMPKLGKHNPLNDCILDAWMLKYGV